MAERSIMRNHRVNRSISKGMKVLAGLFAASLLVAQQSTPLANDPPAPRLSTPLAPGVQPSVSLTSSDGVDPQSRIGG